MPDPSAFLPLSPRMFHILIALAAAPQNGYQVALEVEANSRGTVRLSPATQYENLHRLASRGLIEEADDDPDLRPDGRRQRYWRLTELGRRVLAAETERLAADVRLAVSRAARTAG